MLQQFIGIFIILFFLSRLFWQKKKKHISVNEFIFWLIFWMVTLFAIIFLKQIDKIVAQFGFSSSGIEILLYLAVVMLFYFIFRLRLRFEKIEKQLTKIIREISLKKYDK